MKGLIETLHCVQCDKPDIVAPNQVLGKIARLCSTAPLSF